jgi:insulysin
MYITKPQFDLRNYIGGNLINNIKYIIITDTTLDKTHITVNIKAGSYNEPTNYDGLAHFLEHMLFMGSEKYPEETFFMDKIAKYSGYHNAYTEPTETCYYLGFSHEGFNEIIDIFSRFFIDPLFLKDSIDREMNSVNNEHLKNINDDNWIFIQFIRNISSNKNIFATGNLETLNKTDIREKMIEFYNKYYISQNITICVASNIESNNIINILNNTFGTIKEQNNNEWKNTGIIFKEKGSNYYLKSIRDINRLVFIWEIPEQIDSGQYKTKEFIILGHILTINTENSLKFYLKNNGLINNIYSHVASEGYFEIYFDLTSYGIKNIDKIEILLNTYLELIYKLDFVEIITYFNKLNLINFNFLNKVDTLDLCIHLASNLHYYTVNDTYIGSTVIEIINNNHYINIYKKYIRPNNQIKILINQHYNIKNNKIQKIDHYNSIYSKIELDNFKFDEKYFNKLKTIDLTNEYIGIKPIVIKGLDKYEIPTKVSQEYWYGGISKFNEPIIYFTFNITNNMYYNKPNNYLLTIISCTILNYLLSIKFYTAFKIGYSVSFHPSTNLSSIIISGNCLNDQIKFNYFIEELVDFIKNIKSNIKILSKYYINSIISIIEKSIRNNMYSNPVEYSDYIIMLLTNPNEFPNEILLEEIKNINITIIIDYIEKLFTMKSNLTTIFYGSLNKFINTKILNLFNNQIKVDLPKIKPFWLCDDDICPINNKTLIIDHPDKNQKSSCVIFYYNVGIFIPKNNLLLYMIINILADKFFDELRTKQQLGYLVSMDSSNIMNNYALTQRIQSDKSINEIINSLESFNKNMLTFIKKSKMLEYKKRIRDIINSKDNNTYECFLRYSSEILNRNFLFNRKDLLIKYIDSITFNDLEQFIKKIMNEKNCIKIIIKGHNI